MDKKEYIIIRWTEGGYILTRKVLKDNLSINQGTQSLNIKIFNLAQIIKLVYINGKIRTVIQGSIENRKRTYNLKEILRGRPGKFVTILRAEDVYMLR